MFIEANRLNQLNKNIFGHGILEMKKLTPDSGRMVMPDPSLPRIKRYNIKSNNPLNYLLMTNVQSPNQGIVSNPQESQMPPEPQENINVNVNPEPEELYSQKEEVQEINEQPIAEPIAEPVVEPEPVAKKFAITDLGENNVLLPPNYGTDDELEYKFINLINEPKEHYKFACENDYAKVYKKKGENDVQLLKTYGTIPFPLSKIRPVLGNVPEMDKWDKTFSKHELIQEMPEENGMIKKITYLYIKMPAFITDRDLVQESKTWSNYNGNPQNYLSINRSTTNSKYPVKEKPIRAEMIIGGMYLKEINPSQTLIYLVNNFDLKMTTGKSIAEGKAPERAKDFVKNLVKYLEKN